MRKWIERQKNILDFTLSSLFRRKWKNAALVLVYVFIVFLLASLIFFVHAIKQEAGIVLQNAPEMIVQRSVAGRQTPIPLSYMDKITNIAGVGSVKKRLWGYHYDPVTGANYTLMVQEDAHLEPRSIIIGEGISRTRRVFKGGTMRFRALDGKILDFQVKTILPSESELVSSDLILMSEEGFQRLFGTEVDYATDLSVQVKNPRELSVIAAKVVQALPDTRPILRDELLRTYESVFDWRGGMSLFLFAGTLLAFLILAWDKASGISHEERREIGILKGIGWETSEVVLMKFWEGMVVSLSSFLAGVILAYIHVFFTSAAFFEPALKGWAVLYPRFRLTPFIDASQVATLLFLTVVPYTLATIIPSWRAATVDPDSVMRM
jgi:ABC-type lipoprotein release transport system permease subunit